MGTDMNAPKPEAVKAELDKLTKYYAINETTGDIVHYPDRCDGCGGRSDKHICQEWGGS